MSKIIKTLAKIRIEEYFLFLSSFFLFLLYFLFFQSDFNWFEALNQGLVYLKLGGVYFTLLFHFFIFILFIRIWFWLSEEIIKSSEKRTFFLSLRFKIKNIFQKTKGTFPLLRLLLWISLFFSAVGGILGFFSFFLKERLLNNQLAEIDRFLFGQYPFIWFQAPGNFLKNFDFLFVKSFLFLSFIMGAILILFYLARERSFLSRYIISISLAVLIALPLWFLFPSNSPQNAFLNNVYQEEINQRITESVINYYQPTDLVTNIQGKIGEQQKEAPPISTMPSMHVTWAIIITYLAFQYDKRTIFLTLPWAIFSSLGAVFLAQHYFIDLLVAFPIAGLSLWISSFLVKFEKKYYHNPEQDLKEKNVKIQIRDDLFKITLPFRIIFSEFKKWRQ